MAVVTVITLVTSVILVISVTLVTSVTRILYGFSSIVYIECTLVRHFVELCSIE